MKHPWSVTLLLVILFLVSQLVGLWLVNESISDVSVVNGTTTISHATTAIGERPPLHGYQSFLYLLLGVLGGTLLLLLLVKFHKTVLWKAWFLLAVFLAQTVAYGVLLPQLVALALALLLAIWKVYKPNPIIHNVTEVFLYAGIAVLLVPLFNVFWMLMILLAISVYDFIAVWKTKHMVSMARFQANSNVFAGFVVPKKGNLPALTASMNPVSTVKSAAKSAKKLNAVTPDLQMAGGPVAILGGGDIAFPLLFTGTVMESLIRDGLSKTAAFEIVLLVTAGATLALLFLFLYSEKGRFYPAMPFLTIGCVAGWLVTLLL